MAAGKKYAHLPESCALRPASGATKHMVTSTFFKRYGNVTEVKKSKILICLIINYEAAECINIKYHTHYCIHRQQI